TVISKIAVRRSSDSSPGAGRGFVSRYEALYRYQAGAGTDLVGRSELAEDEWGRLRERGPIAVVYVEGRPWLHRIGGEGASWLGPAIFLGVGGLGMAGGGWAAAWGWRGGDPRRATGTRRGWQRLGRPAE